MLFWITKYCKHLNTRHKNMANILQSTSENQTVRFLMVIFQTLFESGFQMLWPPFCIRKPYNLSGFEWSVILLPFENWTGLFLIAFISVLIVKQTRLVDHSYGIRKPDTNRPFQNWSGFRMVTVSEYQTCLVFKWPEHSKTGQICMGLLS
jgi:hypothetical protein